MFILEWKTHSHFDLNEQKLQHQWSFVNISTLTDPVFIFEATADGNDDANECQVD